MSLIKKNIICSLSVALCVVLPMAFHAIPKAGLIYTPMHIPVLVCGLITGGAFGLICGILGPIISSLLTGMPPSTMLPTMIVELSLYGLITGVCMSIKIRNKYVRVYSALALALLLGRVASGVIRALIFSRGTYTLAIWFTSYFVTCLPGLIIQIIFVPICVFTLEKARLIDPLDR